MDKYICPHVATSISHLLHGITDSSKYTPFAPPRRLVLIAGQSGIDKGAQVLSLLPRDVAILEIQVGREAAATTETLKEFWNLYSQEGPTANTIIIYNAHLLNQQLHDPIIREFAFGLRQISMAKKSAIIAISDEPPIKEHPFYDQFDICTVVSLPKIDHLTGLYAHYFKSVPNTLNPDEDFIWLAQCSDYCTSEDIALFMRRLFYYTLDNQAEITRDLLEDTNHGFMYDANGNGILSITNRDTRLIQSQFDTASGRGVVPINVKKRKAEDKPTD